MPTLAQLILLPRGPQFALKIVRALALLRQRSVPRHPFTPPLVTTVNESSVDKEDLKRFNCQSFQVFFPFINNTGLNKLKILDEFEAVLDILYPLKAPFARPSSQLPTDNSALRGNA